MKIRAARFCVYAAVFVLGTAGCTDSTDAPAAAVVTLFDIAAQLQAGKQTISPLGLPTAGHFSYDNNKLSVDVTPAFAEGKAAAYVTTEYWTGFSKVWVQPMYVMVRDTGGGTLAALPGALPVFSVGPDSAFYSPYWHVFYVVVPPGASASDLRTTRAVLDSGYPLIPGPPRLCSLAPLGTDLTRPSNAPATSPPLHPLLQTDIVGNAVVAMGWVDGFAAPLSVISFGDDRFTYNRSGVIDESPLYIFRHQAEGLTAPKLASLPSVGGRGQPSSPNKPEAPNNRPAFGSLWRFYFVDLPATAGAIVPDEPDEKQSARGNAIALAGLTTVPVNAGPAGRDIYFRPVLNVAACAEALNAALTTTPGQTPSLSLCQFLDSQARIEELLSPAKVVRSDILATCPWVSYEGKAVSVAAFVEPRP